MPFEYNSFFKLVTSNMALYLGLYTLAYYAYLKPVGGLGITKEIISQIEDWINAIIDFI